MSDSYGLVGWEYPKLRDVKIPETEEESGRFTFPDWLKARVFDKRHIDRSDKSKCVFYAFNAKSASKNTAIPKDTLRQEGLTIFLGILGDLGWTVYLLDAGEMQRMDAGKMQRESGSNPRFNINNRNYTDFLKEQEPILKDVNEGGNAQ